MSRSVLSDFHERCVGWLVRWTLQRCCAPIGQCSCLQGRRVCWIVGSIFTRVSLRNRAIAAQLCLCADSIFSDWDRELSPLRVAFRSVAAVRNTVFRNMRLSSEVADVSYGGTVHFNNTAFANVSLARGHVVSTTASDYESPFVGVYFRSYAEDDAAYDVDVAPLPRADAGVFGAEFEIADDLMSDCMYMVTQYDDESNGLQPGCPPRSVAQRWRVRKRSRGNNAVLRTLSPEEVQRYEDYGNTAQTASGGLGVAPAPSSGMGDGVIRTLSPEEMQAYDAYYEPGEYEFYYAPAPAPGSEAAEVLDVRTPPGPATGPSPPGFDGGGTSEVLGAAKKVTDDAWLEEPQARYEGLLLSMDDAWFKNARAVRALVPLFPHTFCTVLSIPTQIQPRTSAVCSHRLVLRC